MNSTKMQYLPVRNPQTIIYVYKNTMYVCMYVSQTYNIMYICVYIYACIYTYIHMTECVCSKELSQGSWPKQKEIEESKKQKQNKVIFPIGLKQSGLSLAVICLFLKAEPFQK